jgi:hypothetical protein
MRLESKKTPRSFSESRISPGVKAQPQGIAMQGEFHVRAKRTAVLWFFVSGLVVMLCAAQQRQLLPVVVSASVPFYPTVAQKAHIDGVIRLRVTTDGARVSSIEVITGSPMLAQIAKDNVKTWQFDQDRPTTFVTTFHYRILPSKCDDDCNCTTIEPPAVVLHLPTSVEISAAQIWTCDPLEQRKPR